MDVADYHPRNDESERSFLPEQTCSARIPSGARTARRVEPRLGVDSSLLLRLVDLAADFQGRIVDISPGGCHIRTDRRFPVGIFRRVEIEFRIEGLPFRLGGVTQAVYDPFNVGIRFLDLSERKREQLQQLIDEIKALEASSD
jgi:hypothetical protein